MDLIYIPEVLTYGSFRHPQYRDYEQPWNKDYFNHDKSSSSTHCHRSQQQQNQVQLQSQQYQQQKGLSKENCHLCRESKRRSLAAYIKSKSRKDSCQEIHEEKEEDEQEKQEEKEGEENTNEKSDDVQDAKDNLEINKAKKATASGHKHC